MQIQVPPPLAGMAELRQFILVRLAPRGDGKMDKLPCDWRTGAVCSAHDSSAWTGYYEAQNAANTRGAGWGVGFVFTADCGFWFLDIDGALQGGQWSPLATELCQLFPGAAIEVSNSGKGLHIFGRGHIPLHACKNVPLGLELYHEGRFVMLGYNQIGDCRTDHSGALAQVVDRYFQPTGAGDVGDLTDAPSAEWAGPTDDDELIQRALASKSALGAFGAKASFADLWTANAEVLATAYPDSGPQHRAYDASSADAALMQHLAFWTGKHGTRMIELARKSALVREKWERDDYLYRTATRACAMCKAVLKTKAQPAPADSTSGFAGGFMSATAVAELFKGCTYVLAGHFAVVPGYPMPIKPDRFNVLFGGFTFGLDAANERTTKQAWEAWTLSQIARPATAHQLCFRPTEPSGAVIKEHGLAMANIWVPAEIERRAGDVGPFMDHLRRLLPNAHDQQVLMSYLAAVVQHQGVKFTWAPLLQGVEGNGKTFFTECLQNAVGPQYVHIPRADQVSKNFNSWLFGKVLIAVEDVFVAHDKVEVFEILKPMITLSRQSVEMKGVDAAMADVVANFLFNSNHQDGLRKSRNDRRIAPLFCAQQQKADLQRDGMTNAYFRNLYRWYRHEGGRTAVNEFLWSYKIPEGYNPAVDCERAPETSSTLAAISAGLGVVEQHVQEAIDEGRVGFRGGWVSSTYLANLLKELRLEHRVPPARRRSLMQTLGYDWHPGLPDGRTDNMVLPEMQRSKLYIKAGHEDGHLTSRPEIVRRYTEAQK